MPLPRTIGTGRALLGGGARFLPNQINGLALWLRADSLGLADGVAVSSWSDESGNSRTASQATGTKQPLCKTGIVNGKPVVRFDSTDDCLMTSAIDFSGTAGLTLFVVTNNIPSGTDRMLFETSANFNLNNGSIALFRDTSNKLSGGCKGNVAGTSSFASTASITTSPTVCSMVCDFTLATNETTNWINGASAGTRPTNANNTSTFGNHAANIGSRGNGASLPLGADIAEIILYNSALSAANRQLVERYLGSKYAITVA